MGAMRFEQFVERQGTERSVAEAFERGVSRAQYDHGHEGYSGTLAEKGEFVLIAGDGGVVHQQYGRAYFPVSAFGGARQDAIWPETGPVSMYTAQETIDRLFRENDERIEDKWGAAGAIRVVDEDHDGWVFLGLASS